MRRLRRGSALAVLVVTAAGLTACGSGRGPAGTSPSPSPTGVSTSTAVGPSSSGTSVPGSSGAGTTRTTQPPSSHPTTKAPTTRPTTPATTRTPPARLLGTEWERIPTSRHVVALTFDAGANAAGLPSILSTLRREHVTATFFLTGQWVTRYPAEARTVCAGFRVGDHSQTHPHFTELSDARIRAEVLDAAATIRRVCGADPWPLLRFPFGDRDARTIAVVNSVGYVPVRWTVDTLGWEGTSGGQSTSSVVSRVDAALRPGEIVLMHVGSNPKDGTTLDAQALPTVIAHLRARGYGFVSLDALLA